MELDSIKPGNWQNMLDRAAELTRKSIKPPVMSQKTYQREYPGWLYVVVIGVLAALFAAASYISAGKEIIAFDAITKQLANSIRIDQTYINFAIIAGLLMPEFAVIGFGFAAAVIAKDKPRLMFLFRAFQFLAVSIAIVANVSVTCVNPLVSYSAIDWLITIGAPLLSIGIGLAFELLAIDAIVMRSQAIKAYNVAFELYNVQYNAPETELKDTYTRNLRTLMIEGLKQRSVSNRETIEALETDGLYTEIDHALSQEWLKHMLRFSPDETVRLDSAKRLTKRPNSLTVQSNAPTNQTPNNLTGDLTTKQDRVIAFLDANPGDYTVRELADLTGVSTYTASKGLQAHKKNEAKQ